MKVHISVYGGLQRIFDKTSFVLDLGDATTLGDVITLLDKRSLFQLKEMLFDEQGQMRPQYKISLRGKILPNWDPLMAAKENDQIMIFPILDGG
jgi:hypothetical protein